MTEGLAGKKEPNNPRPLKRRECKLNVYFKMVVIKLYYQLVENNKCEVFNSTTKPTKLSDRYSREERSFILLNLVNLLVVTNGSLVNAHPCPYNLASTKLNLKPVRYF